MTKPAMLLSLAVIFLGSPPKPAIADDVPTLDVRATCGAEAQADPGTGAVAACMADEQRARESLVQQWAQFASDSKTRCTEIATGVAGIRSYVELLSCLQMARDVKGLPKE